MYFEYVEFIGYPNFARGFPGGATDKEPTCQCRRCKIRGSIPVSGGPLKKGMATHSIMLLGRTEGLGGLQPMGP